MVDEVQILWELVYVLSFCKDNRLSSFMLFFHALLSCLFFVLFIHLWLFVYYFKLSLQTEIGTQMRGLIYLCL